MPIVVAVTLLLLPHEASPDDLISVRVYPRTCPSPCQVRVAVHLEPHENDRSLVVEADSVSFYRSSSIELDGESEPGVHRVAFKSLPPGTYVVRVSLSRVSGLVARTESSMRVIGLKR